MCGLVLVCITSLLGSAWRAVDNAPALAGPDAGSAASWPARAPLPLKAAYFLQHLPELLMHAHFTHWCVGLIFAALRKYPLCL